MAGWHWGFRQVASFVIFASAIMAACDARAGCDGTWDLSGDWSFTQTNGYVAEFQIQQKGGKLEGRGQHNSEQFYHKEDGLFDGAEFTSDYSGNVEGSIDGSQFQFTIDWHDGSVGVYTGVVDENGAIGGSTYDKNHPNNRAGWNADRNANCKTFIKTLGKSDTGKKTFNKLRAPRPASTATVTEDVDVYDSPGGNGDVIGMLHDGDTVPLGACNADNWCEVPGSGWVWGDFLAPN